MQLKRLEDLLGVALHERRGRQLVLTEAGDQLLVDAKRMVAISDDVFARMTDHALEGYSEKRGAGYFILILAFLMLSWLSVVRVRNNSYVEDMCESFVFSKVD